MAVGASDARHRLRHDRRHLGLGRLRGAGRLFLLALGSPVVALVGVGGAILGLASGTGRRSSAGLLGLAATVVALATAAVFGLAPGLGLIAAVGVVVAGGAVATLAVQRAQQASARDPD